MSRGHGGLLVGNRFHHISYSLAARGGAFPFFFFAVEVQETPFELVYLYWKVLLESFLKK
jgi:hypothetical protein